MKRNATGLSFLGFVALADMIFAVSAGLLLLNPLRLDDFDDQGDAAIHDIVRLEAGVQAAEREISRAEQSMGELEQAIQGVIRDQHR